MPIRIPGMCFITEDDRIALLDLGMVAHIGTRFREKLLRLLLANSEGRGDEAADAAMAMGEPKANFDKNDYKQRVANLVTQNADRTLGRLDSGKMVLKIAQISADCWIRMPAEFTMISKAMMNLDRVVYVLDPAFDPNAIIRDEASNILTRHMMHEPRARFSSDPRD